MKIGFIVDIIILCILGLSIFLGYKKGLTKSFLKIFSFLISLIVATILFRPVSNLIIVNTQIDENIQSAIVSSFIGNENEEKIENEPKKDKENGLPSIFSKYIEDAIMEKVNETKEVIVQEASMEIAITIINIAVGILLFIIVRIILIFVKGLAELVTKIPGIKQCDELGGGIFGLLRAGIVIYIIFTIISLIGPLIENTQFISIVNESIIGSYLYNNNILFNMFF